jgi:hypothetical protein
MSYRVAVKIVQLVLLLPFLLAFGIAGHALLARAVKAVLWSFSPLASGEPEAATYERRVYHTADRPMLEIVGVAAAAGLLLWLAVVIGWAWLWPVSFAVLGAAVVLDIVRWERVAISAHNLWFQRGYRSTVHQVALENIRDLSVDESEAGGFTLRHGRRNRLVRLQVRMADKRVVALPKTDAVSGADAVEAVANHLRMRMSQLRDREAAKRNAQARDAPPADAPADAPVPGDDELRRALRVLRHGAQQKLKASPHR